MNIEQTLKPNILHIVYSFELGGLENGVVNLINATAQKFNHSICCVSRSGKSADKLSVKIPIYELGKNYGNDPRIFYKMLKLQRLIKPDIVHTRNWGSIEGIVTAFLNSIPVRIHSEHGWSNDDINGSNPKRLFTRKIICNYLAHHCIAVSPLINNWLTKAGTNPEKISTIINGVDTNSFIPRLDTVFRKKYSLGNSAIVIGTVCRLDPIKNIQLLIKSFSLLPNTNQKSYLLIAGDGQERSNLERQAKELNCAHRVFFLGSVREVNLLLPAFDIFVLPSKNEGISNTILEAMSCGLPVIASDVGGNSLLVKDQKTGFLFSSNDQISLIRSLSKYCSDSELIYSHGMAARNHIERNFSLATMVNKYSDLYQSLYESSNKSK